MVREIPICVVHPSEGKRIRRLTLLTPGRHAPVSPILPFAHEFLAEAVCDLDELRTKVRLASRTDHGGKARGLPEVLMAQLVTRTCTVLA